MLVIWVYEYQIQQEQKPLKKGENKKNGQLNNSIVGLDNGQSMSLWNPTCPPNLWAAGGLKDEVKIENVMPIEFFLGTNVEALWGK